MREFLILSPTLIPTKKVNPPIHPPPSKKSLNQAKDPLESTKGGVI